MDFTVIVVSFNAGKKLEQTLESIMAQKDADFRVIVKDACSTDGSYDAARGRFTDRRIMWISEPDSGIYDGMNRALPHAEGYVLFLNCGDLFYNDRVLAEVSKYIEKDGEDHGIYYGEIEEAATGQRVNVSPRMDAFACFRNVPNHQAMFYRSSLLKEERFDAKWRVRGDYEHFLRCVLTKGVKTAAMDIVICRYEGGGFSESPEGKKISAKEHAEITGMYYSKSQIFTFRTYMVLSCQPLRHAIATNPVTSGVYNRIRRNILRSM